MTKRSLVLPMLALGTLLTSGCASENERATGAAEYSMKGRNAVLLASIPMLEEECYWGCFTEVCAVFEVKGNKSREPQVVFVRAYGMDDEAMKVGGEYDSLAECKAAWHRG